MLFQLLANNIGNLVNKNELSKILNVSTTVIDNYLTIIKKSFHIYMVEPFYNNLPKEIRKMKKIYFNDLGLRNFFVKNFNVIDLRKDKGELYENFVYKQLLEIYNYDSVKFWHTQSQNEVDFIVDDKYAYEVKYNANLFQYSKYKSFLEKYPEIKFYVISQTTSNNKFEKTNFLKF